MELTREKFEELFDRCLKRSTLMLKAIETLQGEQKDWDSRLFNLIFQKGKIKMEFMVRANKKGIFRVLFTYSEIEGIRFKDFNTMDEVIEDLLENTTYLVESGLPLVEINEIGD